MTDTVSARGQQCCVKASVAFEKTKQTVNGVLTGLHIVCFRAN